MRKSDFLPGSKRLSGPAFNKIIQNSVLSKDILLVKIWRKDGTVLYSNERKLVGKTFEPKANLKKALSGEIAYEQSGLTGKENIYEKPKYGSLVEIYSPVKFKGKTVGAFETYFSLDPVNQAVQRTTLYTSLLLAGGLAILWLSLVGIFRNASRTIQNQNVELRRYSSHLNISLDELKKNYLGTITSLAIAAEARDPYTAGHTDRTSKLSAVLCRELNLSENQLLKTSRAAELHDIGKIGTPESILDKPGELTSKEWKRMRMHSETGARILGAIPMLKDIAPIIRHHHEHYDGKGYPDGLAGDQIPVEARILAVVDAFDAMTSDRPYRKALSYQEAISRLKHGKGSQFDPIIVDLAMDLFRKNPDLFIPKEAA